MTAARFSSLLFATLLVTVCDEQKHIADWTAKQKDDGFTITISPEDDRQRGCERN